MSSLRMFQGCGSPSPHQQKLHFSRPVLFFQHLSALRTARLTPACRRDYSMVLCRAAQYSSPPSFPNPDFQNSDEGSVCALVMLENVETTEEVPIQSWLADFKPPIPCRRHSGPPCPWCSVATWRHGSLDLRPASQPWLRHGPVNRQTRISSP